MSNERCQMIDDESSFPSSEEEPPQQTVTPFLPPFKDGLPFLKESACPFAHVFGGKQARE
jgi:hypothetical protein